MTLKYPDLVILWSQFYEATGTWLTGKQIASRQVADSQQIAGKLGPATGTSLTDKESKARGSGSGASKSPVVILRYDPLENSYFLKITTAKLALGITSEGA